MLVALLKFLGIEVRDLTSEGIKNTQEETGCRCCPGFLMDGCDCICLEEQFIEFDDDTKEGYWTRGECLDYDCSYCH